MANYLITISGPTAIGKTALSIKLARHFDTEIISADSRQFFKEMYIGTAVPEPEELAAAPHHFIQHISIRDNYSVGDFERDGIHKLEELFRDHTIVIMVGGSGLYLKAIAEGLDDFPEIDPKIREKLKEQLDKEGIDQLQKQLFTLDPEYYRTADVQNPHRLIRALEICIGTEKPFSSFLNQTKAERNFQIIPIGLTADREIIYDRINRRVEIMMEKGLEVEARELYPSRELNALNTVGYKELFDYFDGNLDKEAAISEIKKNTRRFAKRQLTWFRKDDSIRWFDYQSSSKEIIAFIESEINS